MAKRIALTFVKLLAASAITYLVIGPLDFFVEGINNKDNSYALIATVKSLWRVAAQLFAAFAAVFMLHIVGGRLDDEISRGKMKERPLTLREATGYLAENDRPTFIVYSIISVVYLIFSAVAQSGKLWLQALYNPLYGTSAIAEYVAGTSKTSQIVGQLIATILFAAFYVFAFYAVQRIRFKKFNS
ncbi:MAG: hypothetical protein IJS45_11600 [Clostridia bacterium]|nr:hypothetical protein [Clostridia bacterium]